MNRSAFPVPSPWRLAWLAMLFLATASHSQTAPALPAIDSIRFQGQEVVVNVTVPPGVKKVTLESRSRLGAGSWVPRAVWRLDGNGNSQSFRLPRSAQAEIFRVRGDAEEALPAAFYSGTNSFVSGASTYAAGASGGGAGGGGDGTAGGTPPPTSEGSGGGGGRTVVESDIWAVSGNTLYFFNQYRGLQVIDLTTPDAPVVTGSYPLPAAGEQMYVLEGNYVVLLARDGCSSGSTGSDSEVVVLDANGGVPKLVSTLPVPGWIQESRMVGTALYVASQSYQPVTETDKSSWEPGSAVSSFDLAAPGKPVVKTTLWYSGSGNVVYATDQYLFVVNQTSENWWQSKVHCIDISAPDGAMSPLGSLTTAGRVPDKFKLSQTGEVLSVISENWNSDKRGMVTVLETFSLANPELPIKLGQLELAAGEQLHAARFDGNRVYIVTFFRVDPLWIVDLSDPKTPRVAGELQVPGWSTYIQPLGDRLVAIGVADTNDWRVAVSLFDVHDSTRPALLSKIPLGFTSSWSEASYDEKAFGVLPDAGLILVPYQGYETNGYANRVQLIDLGRDSLKARGTIEHNFQPRRATVHQDRVYSISGKELLAVNATDRDHPSVQGEVELSWSVDRVFLAGDYLLEIANGNNWLGWWSQASATAPSIRVSKAADPDHPLSILTLTNYLPVLGASLKDGKLYVAQGAFSGGPILVDAAAGGPSDNTTNPATLFLSVIDLSQMPELRVQGQAGAAVGTLGWGWSLQPVWPKPGVLVWSGANGGWGPYPVGAVGGGGAAGGGVAGGGVAVPTGVSLPWWGNNGGRLFAFDVNQASTPQFLSAVDLTTNLWWSFSPAYTADGLIYVSHAASEFLDGVLFPGQTPPAPVITVDKDTGQLVTNQPPIGIWVQRYYLDVVDYGDPKTPTLRPPVNIPGQLTGLGRAGALLYTIGAHYTNWQSDGAQFLDASAYDGVSAALVDSLPLPKDWPHPLLVSEPNVFLGRLDTVAGTSQIETWTLSDGGKFTPIGATQLASFVNTLGLFGKLLVAQLSNSTMLFDVSNPSSVTAVGKGQAQGCLWYDLSQGDGSLEQGLWIPLGDYGVSQIRVRQ